MSGSHDLRDPRRYVAEALGTFVLVVLGPGAAMVAAKTEAFGHPGVALAFGLAVTLIVAATGHLGGAHFNPAVTVGLWSVRHFPAREIAPYVLAQCAGAVAASLALRWLLGAVGGLGATVPGVSLDRAFAIEAGYTALPGFVIMAVATDERTPGGIEPFVLGATVFAGALVTGPLTGGSFNPARSRGPAVAGGGWTALWLYWAAPVLGMVLGMRLYEARGGGAGGAARGADGSRRTYQPLPAAVHPRRLRSMRRSVVSRLVAVLVVFLGALAAPGAALAHGLAHHHEAEHRAEHRLATGHESGPALEAADHHADHPHVRMDAGQRVRVDAGTMLHAEPVLVTPAREIDASAEEEVPHAALPRADPATGPPPRLRAPPAV